MIPIPPADRLMMYPGTETFFPSVEVAFEIKDPAQHYHVPLLISPFAYSTYRGS